MAFFNEFKKKFNEAAQSVTSITKDGMEITRLASESRGINTEIITLHEQIGRIYVESKGTNHEALAPLCARVEELKQRLEELDRQKMQLKNQNRCPACGAGMSKGARFCSSCGQRMPEATTEATPAPSVENVTYCPDCGAMRKGEDPFCAVCGHNYEAAEKTEEEKEAPVIITRPIFVRTEDNSDEAPTDFEAE